MRYTLERVCPDGQVRTQTGLADRFTAASAAYYVLTDNGAANRRQAQQVAYRVEQAQVGIAIEAFGYVFTLQPES